MVDFKAFSLNQWLEHIQAQHFRTIDLKLDRVEQVWHRMGDKPPQFAVTLAGTNGKGSCVAMLESVLQQTGLITGSYTSPHLVRYNERIRINGVEASDQLICDAFSHIETLREDIPLTYFEFGTLCALHIFQQQNVAAWILETGMGGRLDAVNIVDNDVALVTSIGLDHQQWLGDNREVIGAEKAGVFKSGALAICADPRPPASIQRAAEQRLTTLLQTGEDFAHQSNQGKISWHSAHPLVPENWRHLENLESPIAGTHQAQNLSGVVALLAITSKCTGVTPEDIRIGLKRVSVPARCEIIDQSPLTILDVAHNADSAAELARFLEQHPVAGLTYGVLGVLADKDLEPILEFIAPQINHWYLAGLEGERGQSAAQLNQALNQVLPNAAASLHKTPPDAYTAARNQAKPEDRIVIFGSFHTVGDIMATLETPKYDS